MTKGRDCTATTVATSSDPRAEGPAMSRTAQIAQGKDHRLSPPRPVLTDESCENAKTWLDTPEWETCTIAEVHRDLDCVADVDLH